MAGELSYLPTAVADMVENYGSNLRLALVEELEAENAIFVQDGNHGEYRPLQDEFVAHGVPFVRPGDLMDGRIDLSGCDRINEVAFQRVRKGIGQGGDIVLTTNATIGRVAITPLDAPVFVTNPQTTVWRSTNPEILNQYYLFCFMRSSGFQEQLRMHTGRNATFDYISLTKQRSLTIPLPPLVEQKIIAAVLGALDDKIELNRRMNATLEAMARALFQSWFVDFDPVRAKLDGCRPTRLDPAIAALFPNEFEDSELGQIPKDWEVKGLDQIATYLNGLAHQKFPPGDGETLPVIKIAQLRQGNTTGADRCNTDVPSEYVIHDGDVLFSWSGSLEVELWCGGDGALNQHLFKVTSGEFPKWFYYFWTRHHLDDFRLIAADKATTMGHIQRKHLSAAKVVVPPRSLLDAMTQRMSQLVEKIVSNRLESRALWMVRDALLPKLLSGELRAV
jgi:type I restriction enzyme, S subunit